MSASLPPRLGIDELDDQHEQMARLREEIRLRPQGQRTNLWMLLLDHFRTHFRLESWMMREDGFPEVRLHELDHDALLERMDRVAREALDGQEIPDSELDVLERWMESHVRGPDRSLAEFRLETELWILRDQCQWEALSLREAD